MRASVLFVALAALMLAGQSAFGFSAASTWWPSRPVPERGVILPDLDFWPARDDPAPLRFDPGASGELRPRRFETFPRGIFR